MSIQKIIAEDISQFLPLTFKYLKPLTGENFVNVNRYTHVKKYQTYKYPITPFNKKISKII